MSNLTIERGTVLPYFTAGWPSPEGFLAAIQGARRAGCRAFEVGIPFTDPMADGPVIQRTSQQALDQGINFSRALELTSLAVQQTQMQAIAMTYCNLVYSQGISNACQRLQQAGVRGLILPDLTLDEGEPFEREAQAHQIDLVYLCAPTTPVERIAQMATRTRGFLYGVSLRGVTGQRSELPADVVANVDRMVRQSQSACPVLVGFGISRSDQVRQFASRCHGVVVGSALLSCIENVPTSEIEKTVEGFLRPLVEAAAS